MDHRFKEARIRAGMTATAAAKALGVSQTTVSNWDLGRKQPSLELLCKAADLYGVTTDYLLGREGVAESAAPQCAGPHCFLLLHCGQCQPRHGHADDRCGLQSQR